MIGRIDNRGRALVTIALRSVSGDQTSTVEAWIDTGFTGALILPRETIRNLGLSKVGSIGAELGDGSTVFLDRFSCVIEWFSEEREVEAVSNDGRFPLIGIGLLREHRLTVDYPKHKLTLK
jgi:clan AA aspartic protease